MKNDKPDRIERIKQIEEILLANNKGWTRSQLAGRFGVNRSTVKRDIDYICETNHIPLNLATRLLVKKSSFASAH